MQHASIGSDRAGLSDIMDCLALLCSASVLAAAAQVCETGESWRSNGACYRKSATVVTRAIAFAMPKPVRRPAAPPISDVCLFLSESPCILSGCAQARRPVCSLGCTVCCNASLNKVKVQKLTRKVGYLFKRDAPAFSDTATRSVVESHAVQSVHSRTSITDAAYMMSVLVEG
jgi:hypothetical protein